MMRSIFTLGVVALLCAAAPLSAQTVPALTPDAQRLPVWARSIVKIYVRCKGDPNPWTGAGVIVSAQGDVLTAGHVGSACIGEASTQVRVGLVTNPYREPDETFTATFTRRASDDSVTPTSAQVNSSSRRDLALLRISAPAGTVFPFAPLQRANPLPGAAVVVAGFSNTPFEGQSPTMIAGLTLFASNLISVAADGNMRAYRLHYGGGTMIGASGGPVFDQAGSVIGVHSARRDKGPADLLTNYGWATSVRSIPADWGI